MQNKTTTQTIRAASQSIVAEILHAGQQSVRLLGKKLGCSKSAVQRHLQAWQRRKRHPESGFWDTPEGQAWLHRLVFASLLMFGIKNHLGAGQLSTFFRLLRLDTHVGISETALRNRLQQMEALLPDFQAECEAQAHCPQPERVVAMDETFFQKFMVLLLMDLPSGYVLLETGAEDRRFLTWQEHSQARLTALGLRVRHAISDRAQALVKLALKHFGCAAGADLFHAQYELGKWLSRRLARQLKQAQSRLETAHKALASYVGRKNPVASKTGRLQGQVAYEQEQVNNSEAALQRYREQRQAIRDAVHPFDLATGQAQNEDQVKTRLQAATEALKQVAADQKIADTRYVLSQFRQQHADLAVHVGVWWTWVNQRLQELTLTESLRDWVCHSLLPLAYWRYQQQHCQNSRDLPRFKAARERAESALRQHPLTAELSKAELLNWQLWCDQQVKQFQRSSSAVEGRNGRLSQVFHNGRGLTPQRLRALTVIHNYATWDEQGRTPANRLFEQSFPDLFEWLLPRMGVLPLPRQRKRQQENNWLIQCAVPA